MGASTGESKQSKAFGRDFVGMWQAYAVEVERLIDAGEQIVVLWHVHAQGKGSGVTLDQPITYVNTVRDGRLVRTEVFLNRPEALEAAGLRE